MRTFKLVCCLAFLPVALVAAEPGCDQSLPPVEGTGDGWINLIDAQRWRGGIGAPFPEKAWHVDRACLILSDPHAGSSIYSTDTFDNFELEFDWRLARNGNSGLKYMAVPGRIHPDMYTIFLREHLIVTAGMILVLAVQIWALRRRLSLLATRVGFALGIVISVAMVILIAGETMTMVGTMRSAGNHPPGLEYQLIDDVGNEDAKHGPTHQTGALYDLLPPQGTQLRPPEEFNTSRIVVRGTHAEHWLNGRKVLEYEFGSPALRDAFVKSKFSGLPEMAQKSPGLLELQNHGAVIAFRSMRIRRLE